MTDSDVPADRGGANGGGGVSRRTGDDESNPAFDADGTDTNRHPGDDGSESDGDDTGRPPSGRTGGSTGADGADGQVVPRVVGEGDDPGTDPADAAFTREPEPIEPETPQAENVVFVLLGVLGTIALLATVIVPGAL